MKQCEGWCGIEYNALLCNFFGVLERQVTGFCEAFQFNLLIYISRTFFEKQIWREYKLYV